MSTVGLLVRLLRHSGLKRRLGDKRISDSRRGYFALGCCDRAYGGLMRRLGEAQGVLDRI